MKRGLRQRPSLFFGLAAVAGISCLVWAYSYTQSPAEGTVKTVKPTPQTEGVSTTAIDGKAFTIELPGAYKTLKVDPAKAPTTELFSFGHTGALESRRVSITIKSSPPASLREESALLFRQNNDQYQAGTLDLAGQTATEMTKKDGAEITYFIPGKTAYAIIATTSSNPRDSYGQEMAQILTSFRWK